MYQFVSFFIPSLKHLTVFTWVGFEKKKKWKKAGKQSKNNKATNDDGRERKWRKGWQKADLATKQQLKLKGRQIKSDEQHI